MSLSSPAAPALPPSAPGLRTPLRIASVTPKGCYERLYAENLGLVGKVLGRFPSLTGEPREEAYAAGLWGLWLSCQRFDKSRGFAFSTYAGKYIRGHILRCLRTRRQENRLGAVSLETPVGDGESELADMLEDVGAEKPGQALLDQAGFDALLAGLPQRQQEVLRAMYAEERPLSEIAVGMGVTKQRAGQIHLQALATLRKGHGNVSLTPQDVAAMKRQ